MKQKALKGKNRDPTLALFQQEQQSRLTECSQTGWQPAVYDMIMDTKQGARQRLPSQQQRTSQGYIHSFLCPNGEIQSKLWQLYESALFI